MYVKKKKFHNRSSSNEGEDENQEKQNLFQKILIIALDLKVEINKNPCLLSH